MYNWFNKTVTVINQVLFIYMYSLLMSLNIWTVKCSTKTCWGGQVTVRWLLLVRRTPYLLYYTPVLLFSVIWHFSSLFQVRQVRHMVNNGFTRGF